MLTPDPIQQGKTYILTGAGISAESGIDTFRSAGGLWQRYALADVCTPEAFAHSPQTVWKFHSLLKAASDNAAPNAGHVAIASWFAQCASTRQRTVLVTQNIDTLHERSLAAAGISGESCTAMHGRISVSCCSSCNKRWNDPYLYFDSNCGTSTEMCRNLWFEHDLDSLPELKVSSGDSLPVSPCCGTLLRPDVVWFGEEPHHLSHCFREISGTDVFIAIGTSGTVAPASDFAKWVRRLNKNARCVFVNPDADCRPEHYCEFLRGKASDVVPVLLGNV